MILAHKVLRIVRPIEVLSMRVLSWTGVIPSNDEVRRTEVLADDGMPYSLTRARHPHRQRKQSKVTHTIRVLCHDSFVDTNAGVMVDVSRFRETDDGVYEDVCLALTSSSDGEFAVGSVHRITGLEGDYLAPGNLFEVSTQLSRGICEDGTQGLADETRKNAAERTSEGDVVKVGWGLDGLELSTDIELLDLVSQICNRRVGRVIGTKHFDGFMHLVRPVDVLNYVPVRIYTFHPTCGTYQ